MRTLLMLTLVGLSLSAIAPTAAAEDEAGVFLAAGAEGLAVMVTAEPCTDDATFKYEGIEGDGRLSGEVERLPDEESGTPGCIYIVEVECANTSATACVGVVRKQQS